MHLLKLKFINPLHISLLFKKFTYAYVKSAINFLDKAIALPDLTSPRKLLAFVCSVLAQIIIEQAKNKNCLLLACSV